MKHFYFPFQDIHYASNTWNTFFHIVCPFLWNTFTSYSKTKIMRETHETHFSTLFAPFYETLLLPIPRHKLCVKHIIHFPTLHCLHLCYKMCHFSGHTEKHHLQWSTLCHFVKFIIWMFWQKLHTQICDVFPVSSKKSHWSTVVLCFFPYLFVELAVATPLEQRIFVLEAWFVAQHFRRGLICCATNQASSTKIRRSRGVATANSTSK